MYRNSKRFLSQLYQAHTHDEVGARAAAIAFHATIALVPIMLFLFIVFGWLLEKDLIQTQLQAYILHSAGEQVSDLLVSIFVIVEESGKTFAFSLVGIAIALYGTTNLFFHLQKALFVIFNITFDEQNVIKHTILEQVAAFLFMLFLVLLILLLMFLDLVLTHLLLVSGDELATGFLVSIISASLSLLLLTSLFTLVYRAASMWRLSWREALQGALVCAPLILLGNVLFSWIFAESTTLALYGAVGSAVAFLLWMYYLAQIVLIGAECVKLFTRKQSEQTTEHAAQDAVAVL